VLVPLGVLNSSPEVEGIFTELPVLLFFSIYTIIILRWIELYRYTMKIRNATLTKLAPVAFIVNLLLFLFFVITLIVFVTVPNYGEETNACFGKDNATKTTEIVPLLSFPSHSQSVLFLRLKRHTRYILRLYVFWPLAISYFMDTKC